MIKIQTKKKIFGQDKFKIIDYDVSELYDSVDDITALKRKYKYLTLQIDGGGILGTIPMLNLYTMEQKLNNSKKKTKKLNEYFKTIWGTSTGAIISGLIAIGIPTKEILTLYVEDGPNIFDKQKGGALNIFSKATYSTKFVDKLFEKYFGTITFRTVMSNSIDLNIAVVNPITRNTVICNVINTPDMKIADAIRGSMSAPMYFGPYSFLDKFFTNYPTHNILFDGGTGNYNCTLEKCICKSLYKDNISTDDFYVHSLGCGELEYSSQSIMQDIKHIKKFRKIKQILWTLAFAREEATNRQLKWAKYRSEDVGVNFKRIDYKLPKEFIKMDKTNNISKVISLVQGEMEDSIVNTKGC